MSDVMKQQPNRGHFRLIYKSEDGYSVLAQLDGVRKGSMFKVNIEATIESFGELNGYRSDIVKKLGCSLSTVSEAMKNLQADGKVIVEREADGSTTWRSVRALEKKAARLKAAMEGKAPQEDPPESYYRIENFFLTHVFEFTYLEKKDEDGNVVKAAHTVWRRLTPVEVLVLSVFYTHALDKSRSWFWTSGKVLADMLKISPRTVERVLRNLRAAQLIFRPVRGNSRSRHSKYVANMVMIRALCNEYEPKQKKSSKKVSSETAPKKGSRKEKKELQEEKAARERFYSQRKEQAESLADRNKKYVDKKEPRFREVKKELTEVAKRLAYAELYDPLAIPAWQSKQRKLQAENAEILRRLGVKEWQLVPQYRCKLCSDSGYLPSGAPCNCYHEYLMELRAKKDVGESDKN